MNASALFELSHLNSIIGATQNDPPAICRPPCVGEPGDRAFPPHKTSCAPRNALLSACRPQARWRRCIGPLHPRRENPVLPENSAIGPVHRRPGGAKLRRQLRTGAKNPCTPERTALISSGNRPDPWELPRAPCAWGARYGLAPMRRAPTTLWLCARDRPRSMHGFFGTENPKRREPTALWPCPRDRPNSMHGFFGTENPMRREKAVPTLPVRRSLDRSGRRFPDSCRLAVSCWQLPAGGRGG